MLTALGPESSEEREREIIKLLAFVTRYSNNSLPVALRIDTHFLAKYTEALAELIREENTPRKG